MYLGGIFTIMSFPIWTGQFTFKISVLAGILFLLPGGIDGTTQLLGMRESTNKLRVITGLLLGAGIVFLAEGIAFSLSPLFFSFVKSHSRWPEPVLLSLLFSNFFGIYRTNA